MLVNEDNYDTFESAFKIIGGNKIKWFDAENIDGYIANDDILDIIDDLICEVEHWKEKYEDLQDKIKARLEKAEELYFYLQMKDNWSKEDYLESDLRNEEIKNLKMILAKNDGEE